VGGWMTEKIIPKLINTLNIIINDFCIAHKADREFFSAFISTRGTLSKLQLFHLNAVIILVFTFENIRIK
jgi:hypothetical protein